LRRSEVDVRQLRAAIPLLDLGPDERFMHNRDRQSVIVAASGNTVLYVCAQPIFTLLQTNLSQSMLGTRFHEEISAHHHALAAAIEDGDEARAGEQMSAEHLALLHTYCERVWRDGAASPAKRDTEHDFRSERRWSESGKANEHGATPHEPSRTDAETWTDDGGGRGDRVARNGW
jgi:hypothetical protein